MAEKRRRQRKRHALIAVVLAVVAIGAGVAFAAIVGGGKAKTRASGTPTPPVSPTAAPSTVTPSPGPSTVACGAKAPKDATTPKPQFSAAPPMQIDTNKTYLATFKTSCGTIVVKLLASQAPQTVNSFVFLADKGYFDGTRIHRLDTSIDVIQGGDPTGTGSGGPGYSIPDELTGKESYGPGVLAMANAGPNTGGSQFFIITGPKGHKLDANPNYTIFGQVVQGLGVAKKIQNLPIQDPSAGIAGQQPKDAVYIESITITAKK